MYFYVDQLRIWASDLYRYGQEGDNIQVCLVTNGVVMEPVHIHVETTHTTEYGPPAIGIYKTDIKLLQRSMYA